jgi:1L-myo-inositol 1-phosphate cytidylyltransferase / CDP-L-myo-inositol myo-inositolphosphotransferase
MVTTPIETPPLRRPNIAVVLAAGKSERLREVTGGGSKALVRVAGMALVERAVRTLLAAAIDRVVVVTGYHAGPVGAVAARSGEGRLQVLYAENWELGNGASLGAAERTLDGTASFLVVAADHLFGEGAFRTLLSASSPACLVDVAPSSEAWDEGTRVRIRDGRARAFGKGIDEPAIDCGAFLLTPTVFEAHRQAMAGGDASLAGAISALAARQPLTVVPLPEGCWWYDVDTPQDLQAARVQLRRSLVTRADGPVSRYLNRPVSTRMSMILAPLRPSPDLVSVLVAALGLLAAWLLAAGEGLAGGLLAQAVSVLDGVDGELARLQIRASPRGALLDGVLDRVVDVALVGALGVWALHAGTPPRTAVVLVAAAAAGSVISMATKDRVWALGLPPGPERAIGYLLGGRDGRLLLIGLFAVLQRPAFGLAATAIGAWLSATVRVIAVRRRSHPERRASRVQLP